MGSSPTCGTMKTNMMLTISAVAVVCICGITSYTSYKEKESDNAVQAAKYLKQAAEATNIGNSIDTSNFEDPTSIYEVTQFENGQISFTILADGKPKDDGFTIHCKGHDTKEIYRIPFNKPTTIVRVNEDSTRIEAADNEQ